MLGCRTCDLNYYVDCEPMDAKSGDAQSGDADQGMSMASAKPSGKAGIEPALASRRGLGHGAQAQSAPGPNLMCAQIRVYLFAEGLTAEDMQKTKEIF